jgi:hypothetical protein
MSEGDLDRRYPSIVAPEVGHLDDIVNDNEDHVLQAGLREVEKIRQTMRAQGRRRRPLSENPTHGTLSLCVDDTAVVAVLAIESGTAVVAVPTAEAKRADENEQASAGRANNAFSNYVASAHEECGVSRVGRLAIVGDAWRRRAQEQRRATTNTTTSTAALGGPDTASGSGQSHTDALG